MATEYLLEHYRVKRIHNIRDFVYRVDLKEDFSSTDLALLLNFLTDETFFWVENGFLHSTSDVDWPSLLPEEVKKAVNNIEPIKEGYLAESKLPFYTTFALFTADFNKIFSPNFKANPLFKRLRKRTKEGWNLSRWMKFTHDFALNYKFTDNNFEYQTRRWFAVKPDGLGFLTFALKSGVEINGNIEEFLSFFDNETLKNDFAYRVKGSYRIGRLKEISPEGLFTLIFDGNFESDVPKDKVIPIFLPNRFSWKEKDKSGLLKALRLTPKVLCKYRELLLEELNRLLEPFMVRLEEATPRWEKWEISPYVVVDKPIPQEEVANYILSGGKVYNAPFESLKLNIVDLVLKSEKNKKLLREAKTKLIEDLNDFFEKIGVKFQFSEPIFDKKLKEWTLKTVEPLKEFLRENTTNLQKANFNIVLVLQPESFPNVIRIIPVWKEIERTLKGTKFQLVTDRGLKVFFKSQKEETKQKFLLELLKEIFKTNGGSLFILDEPMPFARVIVETEKGYEMYNPFGELLEITQTPKVEKDDVLISYSRKGEKETVFVENYYTPTALKVKEGDCSNSQVGVAFKVRKTKVYTVLKRNNPFGYKVAYGIELDERLDTGEVIDTLFKLTKLKAL